MLDPLPIGPPLATSSLPPIVLGLLLLVGLLWISAGLGRLLLRAMRVSLADPIEAVVAALALGLGALQFLPFALFALGIGRALPFRVASAVLALAVTPQSIAVLREAGQAVRRIARASIWLRFIVAIFALLFVLVFLRSVCPVTDDDALSYHLTTAVRYLRAGRFVYIPTITPTNWPVGVELLYALLLAIHPAAPVAMVSFLLGVLTVAVTWLLGRRLGGAFAGATGACIILLYPHFWEQMANGMNDLGLMLFASLAVFFLIHRLSDPAGQRLLVAAGICAGLAATAKLTGVWVIVALGLTVLITGEPAFWRRARAAAVLVVAGIPVCAPHFLRTWALTGNPTYPMLYRLFGGIEWTASGWPRYLRDHLMFNSPPWGQPTDRNLAIVHYMIMAAGTGLAAIVIWRTRQSPNALPARYAGLVTAAIAAGSYASTRFFMPAFPAAQAATTARLGRYERRLAPVVCALALVFAIERGLFSVYPRFPEAAQVAFGIESRDEYYANMLPDYPIMRWLNTNVPPETVVLAGTWMKETAFCRATALWPDYWLQDSIHYDSHGKLAADLRRMRVEYLIYKSMDDPWCGRSYHCTERRDHETEGLGWAARTFGVPIMETAGNTLYRLDYARAAVAE